MEKIILKKMMILFLMLCTGCQFFPDNGIIKSLFPPASGFEADGKCPHLCWLGINPGTTTEDQTKALLKASSQIEKLTMQTDGSLLMEWYPKIINDVACNVDIHYKNGLVETINFEIVPYTIDDFVKLMGEPDKIRISIVTAEIDEIQYAVYFSSRKVMIGVYPANPTGPNPSDPVEILELNSDFTSTPPLNWGTSQPWLGYGHLKDYLPGQRLLHGPNITPQP